MVIEKEWIDTPQTSPANAVSYWWVQVNTGSKNGHLSAALADMLRWCASKGYTLMNAYKGSDGLWRFKACKYWDRQEEIAKAIQLKDKVINGLADIEKMD